MSVLLTVIAAIAAFTLITKFQYKSATALGKVGAIVSATAAFAEAWSKTQAISSRLSKDPTKFVISHNAPPASAVREPVTSLVPPRKTELDEFFDEYPSTRLTGGLRGYSAYNPPLDR